jgi:hypothetical protein
MKKRFSTVILVFAICCFMIIAIASGDDDDPPVNVGGNSTNDNNNTSDDNTAVEGAAYEITYQNATTWVNSIGTVWVQAVFEITNVGDTELYLGSGACDIEDKDGNLVKSIRMISSYPTVLAPGESGFYHETTTLDVDSAIDVVILPRPDIKRGRIENVRLDVTDVSFSEQHGRVRARGRVENTTDELQSSVTVAILLYDSNDIPIGVISTTLMEDIAVGDRIGFEASAFSLPPNVTPDSIARYEAFAYPWLQWQF